MHVLMVVVVLILTSSTAAWAVTRTCGGFLCTARVQVVHKKLGCVGKVRYAALSGSVSTRGIGGLGVARVAVSGAYDAPLPRPCPLRLGSPCY
jgi:hypothetical protein